MADLARALREQVQARDSESTQSLTERWTDRDEMKTRGDRSGGRRAPEKEYTDTASHRETQVRSLTSLSLFSLCRLHSHVRSVSSRNSRPGSPHQSRQFQRNDTKTPNGLFDTAGFLVTHRRYKSARYGTGSGKKMQESDTYVDTRDRNRDRHKDREHRDRYRRRYRDTETNRQ